MSDLYELAMQHNDPYHPHSEAVLNSMSIVLGKVGKNLTELESRGMVRKAGAGYWALTAKGHEQVKKVLELKGK